MRWIAYGAAGLIALPLFAILGVYAYNAVFVNPKYTAQYFEGQLEIGKVLASRRWHRLGAEGWDCSYAIAEISPDLPPDPPESWQIEWKPTPAAPLGETTRDAVDFCRTYYSEDTQARLESALTTPGSFYDRDGVGETVWIYAPRHRIAARIRYGD